MQPSGREGKLGAAFWSFRPPLYLTLLHIITLCQGLFASLCWVCIRKMHPSRVIVLWMPILFMSLFALPGIGSQVSWHSPNMDDHVPTAASEIQELRSKLLYLESILEMKSNTLKQKHSRLEEKGQAVDQKELEIQSLKDVSIFKNPQDGFEEERVNVLEQKVRLLWDESRKNNFKLHVLEEQAEDSEKKLETLSSHLQKVKDIVTEQWIQIQQLEQALLMAKMRVAKERLKHNPHSWWIPQDEIIFFLVSATIVFPLLAMVHVLVGLMR